MLCELGEVRSYEGSGGVAHYDGYAATHHHFRCDRCGEMQDIEVPVDCVMDRKVAECTGLDVRYHVLEFRGLCHECCAGASREGTTGENERDEMRGGTR